MPLTSAQDYEAVVSLAQRTFERRRMLPAPKRGEIVREIGDESAKGQA